MPENSLRQGIDVLDAIRNRHLDNIWFITTRKLIAAVSLHQKATSRTGLNSFGPSMSGVAWYAWDAWSDIVENLTRPSIKYIDVRSFSLDKLEMAINFDWVKERNMANSPEKKKKKKDPVSTH